MKTCFKCGKAKPVDEFYAHPEMGDGHLGKCKECTKVDSGANHWKDPGKRRAYDRERYYANSQRRRQIADRASAWNAKYPERYKAHNLVSGAVRDHRLERKPCEICGNVKVHAHHDDYAKPLDVRWLCVPCHAQIHANERMV